jgi:hypothetical protein
MHTKKLTINYGSQDEEIEYVAAGLPNRCVAVLLLAFLIETVNLCDLARFVVSSNEYYPVWVPVLYVS